MGEAEICRSYGPPHFGYPGVQAHMLEALFPDLIGPVVGRLREWTAGLRSQGARMLHALLLRVGPAAEAQLPLLLTVLRAAAGADPNPASLTFSF